MYRRMFQKADQTKRFTITDAGSLDGRCEKNRTAR